MALTEVLVYENRKIDPMIYDISTPEQRAAAFLAVFELLDTEWQVYTDLTEYPVTAPATPRERRQQAWLIAARAGDAHAAECLLRDRHDYEYEHVRIVAVIDPLAPTAEEAS